MDATRRAAVVVGILFLVGYVAVFGRAAMVGVASLMILFGRPFTPVMALALPYVPFEVVFGIWAIVRGFK